ncbi:MAG: prenyltransferase/squalene oxidase repeat-containing protein [Promethearchaeota archaeon]
MKRTKILVFVFIGFIIGSIVSSATALTRRNAALNFIESCSADRAEGFYSYPSGQGTLASIEATNLALQIIDKFDTPVTQDSFDDELEVRNFLDEMQNKSITNGGGFRNLEGSLENVKATWQAYEIYEMFNATHTLDTQLHVDFVLDSFNTDVNGFGPNPSSNSTPDIFNTYYALKFLDLTENLTEVNLTLVETFVNSCRSDDMFKGSTNSTAISIIATSFAVSLYDEFFNDTIPDRLGVINAVVAFLTPNYDGGAFKDPAISGDYLLSTTYWARKLLDDLGIVQSSPSDDDEIEDWIISKQASDGGFFEGDISNPTASSSLEASYYAMITLYMINSNTPPLLSDVPWELNQNVLLVSVIVVVSVILFLIVLGVFIQRKNRL